MKTLVTLFIAACLAVPTLAQEPDTTQVNNAEFDELIQLTENEISVSDSIDKQDTMHVRIGKHHVEIVTGGKKARIDVEELDDFESKWDDYDVEINDIDIDVDDFETVYKKKKKKMDGHWAGIDFGSNLLLVPDGEVAYPVELYPEGTPDFLAVAPEKSFEVNWNFAEYTFGFGQYVGIVTGLGLNFNDYKFKNKYTLVKDENGVIQYEQLPEEDFRKSKLSTVYLTAPLMLELQIPGNFGDNRLFIAGGVIGGVKLGEHTKYKIGNNKVKDKGSFNVSPYRWGYTARVGFDDLGLFANYYPNSTLFVDGKGPARTPLTIGITATF